MTAYVIKRVLLIIPTMILITMIVFIIVRFIPGNVVDLMVEQHSTQGMEGSTAESQLDAEMVREMLGLDAPIHIQYARWVGDIILHGNLGESMWTQRQRI